MRALFLAITFLYPLGCSILPALAAHPQALAQEEDKAKLRRLLADRTNREIGHLSRKFYVENGLATLMATYKNSVYAMTFDVMPERDLKPWEFGTSLNGIWGDFENLHSAPEGIGPYMQKYTIKNSQEFRKHFLKKIFDEDISHKPSEWFYDLTNKRISAQGASGLLSKFKDSTFDLLDTIYPEKDLKPWLFKKSLVGIWRKFASVEAAPIALQRYLARHRIANSHEFYRHILTHALKTDPAIHPAEWFYKFDSEKLQSSGLENLISTVFHSSFIEMFYTLYPEKQLRPWLFQTGILGMWHTFNSVEEAPKSLQRYLTQHDLKTSVEFQRHVLNTTFGQDLASQESEYLYQLSVSENYDDGIRTMVDYLYSGSWFFALSTLYPEKDLKPWRFKKAPLNMWSEFSSLDDAPPVLKPYLREHSLTTSHQFRRHIMDDVFAVNVAEQPEEWFYTITIDAMADHKLQGLAGGVYNNSPSRMMRALYPEKNFEMSRFRTNPKEQFERKERELECALF